MFLSQVKIFALILLICSLKHIGLLIYGVVKYDILYWAEDANRDILIMSVILYLVVLIRKWIGKKFLKE
ncbi:hypothetical protein QAZ01_11025 [Glaesserella parasuis]|uniref:Uncharacterized protein n=1 Tax=Glaesserella parasuis TaxID=738 RepID=A0AAJ6AAW4_GLAPU|nr:hypothetical protein [Glaesserella parasuis]MDG6232133.1 hypothetical protein [Glaesserella parasuis]MDG6310873.1 hypothetical protein [Glaesserella parasuis]MDG6361890.1 hypothetical protein [Glaesserella parasuis]MDG6410003.1 hypothetical protein [Glaesserella parasuis]MDG6451462.1 hypothetical protein [Glaesserella parasuis]